MLFNQTVQNRLFSKWLYAVIILLVSFSSGSAQDVKEKKKPIIEIKYFNFNNDSFIVQLSAYYKEEKVIFSINKLNVNLYFNDDESSPLGNITTNSLGEGRIVLPAKFKVLIDTVSSFDLVAKSPGDSIYKKSSASASIQNVSMEFKTEEVDTNRFLHAFVFKRGDKNKTPLADIELNFVVKRAFGMFSFSGKNSVTDENGKAEIQYTDILPGDTSGTLFVGAKLSDVDTYGNFVLLKQTNWGEKMIVNHEKAARAALWASRSNVPLWLLIVSNTIIFGVWGVIVFLILQLFKISKLGKEIN